MAIVAPHTQAHVSNNATMVRLIRVMVSLLIELQYGSWARKHRAPNRPVIVYAENGMSTPWEAGK
jgi:hypothetical protein